MDILAFLLDQIYEQYCSKDSIERAKCDEIADVKTADPDDVLQREVPEVRCSEHNHISPSLG